jgi:hypothetical protein
MRNSLKKSMLGAAAVKHMAIALKSNPPKNAMMGIKNTSGVEMSGWGEEARGGDDY